MSLSATNTPVYHYKIKRKLHAKMILRICLFEGTVLGKFEINHTQIL
jgi:hypothetical protein